MAVLAARQVDAPTRAFVEARLQECRVATCCWPLLHALLGAPQVRVAVKFVMRCWAMPLRNVGIPTLGRSCRFMMYRSCQTAHVQAALCSEPRQLMLKGQTA